MSVLYSFRVAKIFIYGYKTLPLKYRRMFRHTSNVAETKSKDLDTFKSHTTAMFVHTTDKSCEFELLINVPLIFHKFSLVCTQLNWRSSDNFLTFRLCSIIIAKCLRSDTTESTSIFKIQHWFSLLFLESRIIRVTKLSTENLILQFINSYLIN